MYFSRVTKDTMIQIATEVLGDEWIVKKKTMKKGDLATLMEQAFADTKKVPDGLTKEQHDRALAWSIPGFSPE